MKILSGIFLSFFSLALQAQIYNQGFESWTNMGNYEVPDQWGTMNNATSHLNVYTVTKWYPGSPGAYFMKITSKMYGSNVMNGIAVYGKLDSTNLQPLSGYPFTLRPENFTGQWQHMIWGTSQGSLCATLTRWNSSTSQRDTIAMAYHELVGMAMGWEAFTLPFVYQSTADPDSCMIVLKASGDDPELNDYLWVDDLAFSGYVGIEEKANEPELIVYPVPASDKISVQISSTTAQQTTITLSDPGGRIILTKEEKIAPGENTLTISLSGIASGIYILRSSSDPYPQKKVIIR
jgi:hypothetical protein